MAVMSGMVVSSQKSRTRVMNTVLAFADFVNGRKQVRLAVGTPPGVRAEPDAAGWQPRDIEDSNGVARWVTPTGQRGI
jgi:hypothetical protein